MAARVTFFPVGNGDMTLITLGDSSQTTLLIDCNLTEDPIALSQLRKLLQRDERGRPYVDAFLITHPDQDHCRGIAKYFYLGDPRFYPDDTKAADEKRIFIRELWSSPMVFRRATKDHVLCEDAEALNAEARRRVSENKRRSFLVSAGDRILILGEDEGGKTANLKPLVIQTGAEFSRINGADNPCFSARLLAPMPKSDNPLKEELLGKNHSSVVLQLSLRPSPAAAVGCRFLTGGDAEVAIWEMLWATYEATPEALHYDLLLCPHHCSWHSLSYDSWSEKREKGVVASKARAALSQIREYGFIVASSKPILDDDNDPPCFGAKRVYTGIAEKVGGRFMCTGDTHGKPLEFSITSRGLEILDRAARTAAAVSSLSTPIKPWGC